LEIEDFGSVKAHVPQSPFLILNPQSNPSVLNPDSRRPIRNPPLVLTRLILLSSIALLGACAHARPTSAPEPRSFPREMSDEAVLQAKSLMVPVAGVQPTRLRNTYTAPRGARQHEALDILAPRGTPVLAADDGIVLRLRTNQAGGITIYQLDAAERFVYYYAHLQGYRGGLKEGMRVRQGDVIGYVGTTGNAPANVPHLHFQLMRYAGEKRYSGGVPMNPLPYLVRAGVEVMARGTP
jgi:peptidoglycan LD-endopeptidase LytH